MIIVMTTTTPTRTISIHTITHGLVSGFIEFWAIPILPMKKWILPWNRMPGVFGR